MSGNGSGPDDDEDIHYSLRHEIRWVFDELRANPEHYTLKERLSVIGTVGMYLTRNLKLQEADDQQQSNAGAGSAVRKYARAFKANVVRGRTTSSKSTNVRGSDDSTE